MRRMGWIVLGVSMFCGQALLAQRWEVGVAGGGSFYTDKSLTNGGASASAGFNSGYSLSAWLGQSMKRYLGGEIRYTYEKNDMTLSSGGTKASFVGDSQAIYYNFLLHTNSLESRVRPYVLAGGGVKLYRGTGTETVTQPLSNIALLTKTQGIQALVTVGAGVKFNLGSRGGFRLEVIDYMSPFPDKVIATLPGTKGAGWINNFVPMVGLAYTF